MKKINIKKKRYNISFNIKCIRVKISTPFQILLMDLNKINFVIQCAKSNLGKKWVQVKRY
ncbi:hypothetical protein A7N09_05995 [Acinetobacter baumannii]|jgi:hypothetical protein|nr:hypothetical protein A7N09_05995 [Acinetobacter baumannii]